MQNPSEKFLLNFKKLFNLIDVKGEFPPVWIVDKCKSLISFLHEFHFYINPHIACCCNLIKLKRHNKKRSEKQENIKNKKEECDMSAVKKAPRSTDFPPYMMSEKCHKMV